MIAQPIQSQFSNTISQNLFAHSYLFYGINALDLTDLCIGLIKDYLKHHHDFCLQPDAPLPLHPDILFLETESSIKIDHIKQIQDKIKYGPYQLNYFFVVIPNCDLCSLQAANAFLKTLEEPIDKVVFFLTSAHFQSVLPTIRSRSLCVYTPTSSSHHLDNEFLSFHSFQSLDLNGRLNSCMDLASDKPQLITQLHNWLTELNDYAITKNTSNHVLIFNLLETLQYNVNVRLQLENFSIQLPFDSLS